MLNRADRKAVPAIVVVLRIHVRGIEVQVVGVRGRVERRGPVVPVRASVVERRTVVVASGGEESCRNESVITWHDYVKEPLPEPSEVFVFPTAHGCRTDDL